MDRIAQDTPPATDDAQKVGHRDRRRRDFADDSDGRPATHPANANETPPSSRTDREGGGEWLSRTHLKRAPCQRHPARNQGGCRPNSESSPSHSRRTELSDLVLEGTSTWRRERAQRVNEFFQEYSGRLRHRRVRYWCRGELGAKDLHDGIVNKPGSS